MGIAMYKDFAGAYGRNSNLNNFWTIDSNGMKLVSSKLDFGRLIYMSSISSYVLSIFINFDAKLNIFIRILH